MTTISGTASAPVSVATAPAPPVVVTVPSPPPALVALPTGTPVVVQAQAAADNGQVTVQGEAGTFTLQTSVPVPAGSTLLLQVTSSAGSDDSVALRLLSVDGKAVPPAPAGTLSTLAMAGRSAGASSPLAGFPAEGGGAAVNTPASTPASTPTVPVISIGPDGTLFTATVIRPLVLPSGVSLGAGLGAGAGAGQVLPGQAGPAGAPGSLVMAGAGGTAAPETAFSPGASASPAVAGDGAFSPAGRLFSAFGALAGKAAQAFAGKAAGEGSLPGQPVAGVPVSPGGSGASSVPALAGGMLPAASQLTVRVAALGGTAPPAGEASPAAGAAASASPLFSLSGTVTGNSAGGAPMVQTDSGLISLNAPVSIRAGEQVQLDVLQVATPAADSRAVLADPPFSGSKAGAWPALQEGLEALADSNPAAARQLMAAIPTGDPRMLANVMAFAQAVKEGEIRKWLGEDPLRALEASSERGRKLGDKLASDVRELGSRAARGASPAGMASQAAGSSAAAGNTGGEWKVMSMPFMDGAAISQITVLTRTHKEDAVQEDGGGEGKKGKGGKSHRFLIDLSLSRLGDFQLDGLYKQQDRQIELMVRTRQPLPSEVRQEIQGIFARSAESLRMKGAVAFRVTPQFAGPVTAAVMPEGDGKGWLA